MVPIGKNDVLVHRQVLGAQAIHAALVDASVEPVDAQYVGNMPADELSQPRHLATLLARHAGLVGVVAIEGRAATVSGATAFRDSVSGGGQRPSSVGHGNRKGITQSLEHEGYSWGH